VFSVDVYMVYFVLLFHSSLGRCSSSSIIKHTISYSSSRIIAKKVHRAISGTHKVMAYDHDDDEAIAAALAQEIQRSNARTAGSIEVRHVGKVGWGVFALKDFAVGDLVLHPRAISAIPSSSSSSEDSSNNVEQQLVWTMPTVHTIQIDWRKHVMPDLPSRFLNHKCGTANIGIDNDKQTRIINNHGNDENQNNKKKKNGGADDDIIIFDFYALQPIRTGDEITFDYETTEYEMLHGGFECSCASPICRKHLRGFKYNGDAVLKIFDKRHIAPYLLVRLLRGRFQNEESKDDATLKST
jgi:uncharacterized protein